MSSSDVNNLKDSFHCSWKYWSKCWVPSCYVQWQLDTQQESTDWMPFRVKFQSRNDTIISGLVIGEQTFPRVQGEWRDIIMNSNRLTKYVKEIGKYCHFLWSNNEMYFSWVHICTNMRKRLKLKLKELIYYINAIRRLFQHQSGD